MDAMNTARWICASCLLAAAGCNLASTTPRAHHADQPPTEPIQPPQVVGDEVLSGSATQPPEGQTDLDTSVQGYIQRLDDPARRPIQLDTHPLDARNPVRYATDTPPPPGPQTSIQVIKELDTAKHVVGPVSNRSNAPGDTSTTPITAEPPASAPLQRPQLGAITVHAAADTTFAAATHAQSLTINNPAFANTAPCDLTDLLGRLAPPNDQDSFQAQLRWRILWASAGDYERARQPLETVTAQQQELAAGFIDAWIVLQESHMGDLPGAASELSTKLDALRATLTTISDLAIPTMRICRAVRGYGQYDTIDPARFVTGIPIEFVLYCEITDFVSEQRADGFHYTTFDMTTTILNNAGDTVDEFRDTDISDRCRNRRRDCFIPRLVTLPPSLSPGSYVAKVTIVDKLGEKVTQSRATFQVAARH